MSIKDKALGVVGGAAVQRLRGEKPGAFRAGAGAALAGGLTGVVVFRLLRKGGDQD
jgi:hypothetical protein